MLSHLDWQAGAFDEYDSSGLRRVLSSIWERQIPTPHASIGDRIGQYAARPAA